MKKPLFFISALISIHAASIPMAMAQSTKAANQPINPNLPKELKEKFKKFDEMAAQMNKPTDKYPLPSAPQPGSKVMDNNKDKFKSLDKDKDKEEAKNKSNEKVESAQISGPSSPYSSPTPPPQIPQPIEKKVEPKVLSEEELAQKREKEKMAKERENKKKEEELKGYMKEKEDFLNKYKKGQESHPNGIGVKMKKLKDVLQDDKKSTDKKEIKK